MYELAQTKFSAGSFRTAHDLYMEALQMFIQIYGPLHITVANCYRQVAKINYMVGEVGVALSFQHKAVLVYERVLGVDHPETLTSYINLAIYCHNTDQTSVALRLMYRARYLLTVMCGEDHPEVATCDCNIALMLHGFKQYESSLKFLENSLRVFEKYHGKQSLQAALTHHLMARVQSFLGDFRAALQNEKSTYSIYNSKFGSDHERTKESSECLKELTQKAVTMQKTINEMTGKSKGSGGGKVLVELPGSWGDVASMINAPEPSARHPPRQKPTITKTHVIRRRNKSSKQQQQQQASQTTKQTDKQSVTTSSLSSSQQD
jgi:protein TIF31